MKLFLVAKVLVANPAGEVLTLRRSKTDDRRPLEWDFPGGWVEEGEDLYAAVKREAKEEAGLELDDPKLVFGLSEVTDYGSGTWLFFVAHVTNSPTITLSYEHDKYKWAKPEELLNEITYQRQRKMLSYVIQNHLL